MGLIETVAEEVRRGVTGDSWFVERGSYILELRAPPAAAAITVIPVTYIVLPLGLQDYRVERIYRQSVTPTVGGLVVEEQGELWRRISVTWDPGLQAKRSIDQSTYPEVNPGVFGLSGPAWSTRLLRNYFDNYAKLKADPLFAADTYLIWHDTKLDEHYVVVPDQATIERSTAKRMRYPVSWSFTAVGPAEGIVPIAAASSILDKVANVANTVSGAISEVNRGVASVAGALQEGSAILGEVRYFAATIDSVLTQVDIAVDAANAFVDGLTDTMNIGRDFIAHASQTLADVAALFEGGDLPDAVRQNYLSMVDGMDTIAAQRIAYGDTYASITARRSEADAGPTGRATDADLAAAAESDPPQTAAGFTAAELPVSALALKEAGATPAARVYAKYSGFVAYLVRAGDSLQSIAARQLGDGALWYDLAVINGLKPPYISVAALPDTARPGDTIKIPLTNGGAPTERALAGDSIYLVDMAWVETGASVPGSPRVTLAVDRSSYTDVRLIEGIPNLSQALQMRVWTERGSSPLAPDYGLRRVLGLAATPGSVEIVKLGLREALLADPRVATVKRVTVTQPQPDQVDLEADIVPIGDPTTQTVRSILV